MSQPLQVILYFCVALCSFIFGVDASAAASMASTSASTSTSAKNARNLTDIKLCGTWHTPGQSHCCKRHSHRTGHVVHGTRTCYMLHAVHSGHAPRLSSSLTSLSSGCQWNPIVFHSSLSLSLLTQSSSIYCFRFLWSLRVTRTRITRDPQSAAALNQSLVRWCPSIYSDVFCDIQAKWKAVCTGLGIIRVIMMWGVEYSIA